MVVRYRSLVRWRFDEAERYKSVVQVLQWIVSGAFSCVSQNQQRKSARPALMYVYIGFSPRLVGSSHRTILTNSIQNPSVYWKSDAGRKGRKAGTD